MGNFAADVGEALRASGPFDAVVGFNKLPGLDLYYAADPCYVAAVAATRPWYHRFGSRYRCYARLEQSVFAPQAKTRILLIAEPELARFQACYGTPAERFTLLPPGIARDRVAGDDAAEIRRRTRRTLHCHEEELVLLQVGSAFRTKGVDRSLLAMAALPEPLRRKVRLLVAGRGDAPPLERLARRLGLAEKVTFLGARDDVPQLLLAADLLLHPARTENTGTVLLEAMAAGLPVLATANCGYAGHIIAGEGGWVIPVPFEQPVFNRELARVLATPDRSGRGLSGLAYVRRTDVFSMPEKAVDAIEAVAGEKRK
jgi:UDP-glucose:(heptosyl)LPS alpha-1,3-glucosyltransferase